MKLNCKGFSLIFLIILLPILLTLATGLWGLAELIQLKSNYQYQCLKNQLQVQIKSANLLKQLLALNKTSKNLRQLKVKFQNFPEKQKQIYLRQIELDQKQQNLIKEAKLNLKQFKGTSSIKLLKIPQFLVEAQDSDIAPTYRISNQFLAHHEIAQAWQVKLGLQNEIKIIGNCETYLIPLETQESLAWEPRVRFSK